MKTEAYKVKPQPSWLSHSSSSWFCLYALHQASHKSWDPPNIQHVDMGPFPWCLSITVSFLNLSNTYSCLQPQNSQLYFFRSGEAHLSPLDIIGLLHPVPCGSITGANTPWLEDGRWNSEVTPKRFIVAINVTVIDNLLPWHKSRQTEVLLENILYYFSGQ